MCAASEPAGYLSVKVRNMRKSTRLTAEEQFQAAQKKSAKILEERELIAQERAERIATLRARRLAQEKVDNAVPAKKRSTRKSN